MKNILVGIDFTEADDIVLAKAKELARAYDGELQLVHIYPAEPAFVGYPDFIYPGLDERDAELKEEKARLVSLVEDLREDGIKASAFMKEAVTSIGLMEFAEKHEDGLLVIGTHSRSLLDRALLGSTADRLIRKSKIPVFVVPTI
jgi:nucleotide-binding universal stress UspA family protein